ncbi:MAG: alpha/beta hydrolase domain-containing protein, partial [Planctomycetota bacterium]|nr:alpha/beta hydrolase domain-containing protein [Planctomycetota bacterium]
YDFYGTLIPFPATAEARAGRGDPRPSVDAIHPSRESYLAAVDEAAARLVEERFLLEEDRSRVRARAEALWDWIASR